MPDTKTFFNFAAALEAVKTNEIAKAFLEKNRARLEELGTQAGMVVLNEMLDLFAGQKNKEAWNLFYGGTTWSVLAEGAAGDVANTAAMAARAKAVKDAIQAGSLYVLEWLLTILVAGFLG